MQDFHDFLGDCFSKTSFLLFGFPRPELDDNVRHCSFLRLLKIVTESLAVLLVGNLLHPFDHLPILLFLNGYVCHGSSLRGAMPVFLAAREPHHVTRSDLLDRSTFALSPAAARRDDQSLAERMCVPCSSRSRLESNASPLNKGGIGCLKKRIDANRPSAPLCRTLRRRLRANSFDLHSSELLA